MRIRATREYEHGCWRSSGFSPGQARHRSASKCATDSSLFWGTVNSEEERRASRILAENLAGVRGVEDHRLAIDFPAYAL